MIPHLVVNRLTKEFGAVTAVADVSVSVAQGEFLTLLGPSGSGKTTTLMLIAGFETPTRGEIVLAGQPVTLLPVYRRNIGVVFQSYALFPHMTVFENVAFPLRLRKVPRAELRAQVANALRLVRLEGLEARMPRQLSGGQQQRVALARALVFGPSLVLMDEPLGALDRKLREEMQAEIKEIQQKLGTTVVYVTHDQEEALTMSDRIVVMRNGRVEQVGPPRELYERPATRFVAEFLGESNVLAGSVADARGTACTVVTAGGLKIIVDAPRTAEPGQAVSLVVRPERIGLVRPGNEPDNVFDGIVERVTYAGDRTKLRVRVGGDIAILITTPNRHDSEVPVPGGQVRIGWRSPDAVLV